MAVAAPIIHIDKTWGAGLIGLIVAAFLYGITCVQTYYYYNNFAKDLRRIKVMVAVLWVLDTFQIAMISHVIYFYVITHFGRPDADIVWSLAADVFTTSLIALMTQFFLIHRIWSMSDGILRYVFVVPLALVSLLGLASGYAYAVRLFHIKTFTNVNEIVLLINMSLGSTVATDILLTLCLSYLLHKSRTGIKRTDNIINTLIMYTVNNGLITSAAALVDVILHAKLPATLTFLAFYFLLSKLYANTLLATLNARVTLRGRGHYDTAVSVMSKSKTDFLQMTEQVHISKSRTVVGDDFGAKTYGSQSSIGDTKNAGLAV